MSELAGTSERPIVVQSYPGEWAVLDGGTRRASTLTVRGSDTWIRDIEVMKSDPKRRSEQTGSNPTDVSRGEGTGVSMEARRTRLINLVIHDNGNGIGFWRTAINAEIYGCVIFNNGWIGPDRGHGHGIYVQNESGTKRIVDTVLFNNFSHGLQAYAVDGYVTGITADGVVGFENGSPAANRRPNVLFGTERNPIDRVELKNGVFFHGHDSTAPNVRLGFPFVSNETMAAESNYFIGGSEGLQVTTWRAARIRGNEFHLQTKTETDRFFARLNSPKILGLDNHGNAYTWNHNLYVDRYSSKDEPAPKRFVIETTRETGESLTFSEWRTKTGFDQESRYTPRPRANPTILIHPNQFERGRAVLTILNWGSAEFVSIDLSGARIRKGARFEIRDVQRLGDVILRGVWTGEPVRLPMTSRSATPPVGGGAKSVGHTPITFGVFVLTSS